MTVLRGEHAGWRWSVSPPKAAKGERWPHVRARRTLPSGRVVETRQSLGTDDPDELRARAQAVLDDLAGPAPLGAAGVLEAMDARLEALEVDRQATDSARVAMRAARAVLGRVLAAGQAPERAALVRARDALLASGLASASVNSYLRRAAASWRWCEERGLVAAPWPRLRALPGPARARKRPYTPDELARLLAWVARWQGGRWLPLLALAADTGRRIGEVARLREADLDRDAGTVRVVQKGGGELVLPVSPDVLAMLPPRASPAALLFPRPTRSGRPGPARPDAVRSVVRRAIRALGIPDGERLDTHSLRRAFVAHAHRAGVRDDVTRRLTGHETLGMLAHYQRETVGDDLRAAQAAVAAWRAAAQRPTPHGTPQNPGSSADVSHGQRGTRTLDPVLVSARARRAQPEPEQAPSASGPWVVDAPRRTVLRLATLGDDALARRACVLAAADPEAMRRVLGDAELRAALCEALGVDERGDEGRARGAVGGA